MREKLIELRDQIESTSERYSFVPVAMMPLVEFSIAVGKLHESCDEGCAVCGLLDSLEEAL